MKKVFKGVVLGIVFVCAALFLTACNRKDSNSIVGSWEYSGYVYTFNADKTGDYSVGGTKMEFTYEDDGKKVSILYTGNTMAGEYEYRIEDNKLIIKDSFGNDVTYTKK